MCLFVFVEIFSGVDMWRAFNEPLGLDHAHVSHKLFRREHLFENSSTTMRVLTERFEITNGARERTSSV